MDVQDVRAPNVLAHLADRLEERQALDVADRAADLDDHDVRRAVARDARDPLLDLVGDVRDDLDRAAEVVPAALLRDHGLVDAARGHVGELGQVLVDEPLVVPEVEVRLGAVVGDEHLAVLVRAHRPRIHVDIRIQLEDGDPKAAGLEEPPDARGGDSLAQRGGDPSGHEDILRHRLAPPGVFRMLPKTRRRCEIPATRPVIEAPAGAVSASGTYGVTTPQSDQCSRYLGRSPMRASPEPSAFAVQIASPSGPSQPNRMLRPSGE